MAEANFSHVVHPSELPAGGATWALEATEAQRAVLARRFGLEALDALSAEISLEWVRGATILLLSGRIRASVVQTCVVTLEPVRIELDDPVEIRFEPGIEAGVELDLDAEEAIEPLEDDSLDIAGIVAEEMALMLDPYPRAPGASADRLGPWAGDGEEKSDESGKGQAGSPFEILAGFRRKQ